MRALPLSRDVELLRITAQSASGGQFVAPDWPAELKPTPATHATPSADGGLPKADGIIWVYTAAEAQAHADVLTPGIHWRDWVPYKKDFASYEPELTGRSPAREERCLAYWWPVTIGEREFIALKNNLHFATDSTALPLRRFWGQIITESEVAEVIDSGTAGDVGPDGQVGDVVVATALRFDCQKQFATETWAQQRFATTLATPSDWSEALALMTFNDDLLDGSSTRPPMIREAHVLTTDFFAMDTVEDYFKLRATDAAAGAVEMDASVLGLVAEDLAGNMPAYTSVRSVSDPQMPAGPIETQERDASDIYLEYGYGAQCNAEIVTAVLAAS